MGAGSVVRRGSGTVMRVIGVVSRRVAWAQEAGRTGRVARLAISDAKWVYWSIHSYGTTQISINSQRSS
jgi:hypothetical protein